MPQKSGDLPVAIASILLPGELGPAAVVLAGVTVVPGDYVYADSAGAVIILENAEAVVAAYAIDSASTRREHAGMETITVGYFLVKSRRSVAQEAIRSIR
jgi:hypothetical protein